MISRSICSNFWLKTATSQLKGYFGAQFVLVKSLTKYHSWTVNPRKTTQTQKHSTIRMTTEREHSTNQGLFGQTTSGNADPLVQHLFEESAALNVYDRSTINLAAGCPGPDLLSTLPPIFKEATQHRMNAEAQNNWYLFQYGPLAGLWGMRDALAKFLTKNYDNLVNRSNLVLTCGATHGLHLIVSILLSTEAVIFVEEFTYMIALNLFKEFPKHRIIKVPMTPNGVDVQKFEGIVAEVKKSSEWTTSKDKPFWAMFYTIPNFHNPTGILLPPDSCRGVVKVARQYDVLIVCDDVYNLLHFGSGAPPPRLFAYDSPDMTDLPYAGGHVISNGSFSKILAPGVRVGWMEVPQRLVSRFKQSGILQSGGSVNNVMFGLMQSVLELGLADKHLQMYKQVYSERMNALCSSLKQHLPSSCQFQVPQGGYFVWIHTPVDASDFLAWCKKHTNFGAVPAVRFMLDGQDGQDKDCFKAVRLSIGFHDVDTLTKAGEIFGEKMKEYLKEHNCL